LKVVEVAHLFIVELAAMFGQVAFWQ